MSIRILYVMMIVLGSGFFCPQSPTHALERQGGLSVSLTEEERAWIKAHPVIRVSNEPSYAPLDYIENGKPVGFSIDFIDMLARRVGLRLEYVQDTWNNLVEMAKAKEIDLLHTVFYTPEREAYFLFTDPYKSVINGIYIRQGVVGVQSLEDLKNKRVVLPKGDIIAELLPGLVPDAEFVFVDTYDAILKAVALGQADATVLDIVVANYLIRKFSLTNILPVGAANIPTGRRDPRYRIAVRKDWPLLHSILQKAMMSLTRDDMARLEARWFSPASPAAHLGLRLTGEERAFLDANPIIRVHNEKDWSPFNYYEYGTPRGLSIDYMNLVANRLGVKARYVTGPSWEDFLGMIKSKELDVMLNIVKTDDRQQYLLFTEPYSRSPNVIVSLTSTPYENMAELNGKVVAIPKGYFYEEVLSKEFPRVRVLTFLDTLECLKAVSLGKVDAALGEEAVIKSLFYRNLISGLRITGEADMGHPDYSNLRLGIRDDWPLLHSAIMKAMDNITPLEMRQIREKWLQPDRGAMVPEPEASPSYLKRVALGLGLFLFLLIVAGALLRILDKRRVSVQFGTPVFRNVVLVGLSFFVIIVGVVGWVTLEENKRRHMQDVERNLKGVLSIFEDRLELWLSEKTSFLRQVGRDPLLAAMTRQLFVVSSSRRDLLSLDALTEVLNDMRAFFDAQQSILNHIDFFVINTNHTVIGAMRDADIGTRHIISWQEPELLDRAFFGEVLFVPPLKPDVRSPQVPLPNIPKEQPAMFFIGPIRDPGGRILAVMALRVTPWKDFARATRLLEYLKTGETYAFDKEGRMLSPSRFDDQLRSIGLLGENQGSALNIEIRDPGVNLTKGERPHRERGRQPLTRMTLRAVQLRTEMKMAGLFQGHSQVETDSRGYRDYRGVPVFGAWLWNMDLDFGLAVEMDVEESMAHYRQTRRMVAGVLGFTLFLAVCSVLLVLFLGERTGRALIHARDSLEEKVAERTAEVKENQDCFAALLESAPDAVVVTNESGDIVMVNSQTERLLGYGRTELLGLPVDLLVPEAQQASPSDKRRWFMADAKSRPMEKKGGGFFARAKNGALIPVDISMSSIESPAGLLMVAAVRDITEQKAAEEALRASEEKIRLILGSVSEGIVGVDSNGNVAFVNSVANALLGYAPDELIGKNVHATIHHSHADGTPYPEDTCPMNRAYRLGHSETGSVEPFWRKDGTGFSVEYTVTPIDGKGGILGALIFFRDITERERMEKALSDSQERFRKIIATSPVGVVFCTKGLIRYTNSRFREMFDVGIGEPAPYLYVNPAERDLLMQRLASGEQVENYELDMYGRGGEVREVLVNYVPMAHEGEEGILGWVEDITRRKQAEKEHKERLDELNHFMRLASDREKKMTELKQEIEELLKKGGVSEKDATP